MRQRYGSKVPSPRPIPPLRAGTGPAGPDDHKRQLPTRRIAAADDIADAVVLAATNPNITGTIIETDGGARLVSLT